MKKVRVLIGRFLAIYLLYVFVFAVLIFAFQRPKEKTKEERYGVNRDNIKENDSDRVALVELPMNSLNTRLDIIDSTRESLDISYYTLLGGESTQLFFASILEAADRGVEVRILLDGIFHNLSGELRDAIYSFNLHPNISLRFYEPLNLLLPISWNNRLHDKIIISDGNLALIGGRNIGDKYFYPDKVQEKYVKDRDVLIYNSQSISNSVIADMKSYFDSVWEHKYSKNKKVRLTTRRKEKGLAYKDELQKQYKDHNKNSKREKKNLDWYQNTIPIDRIYFVSNPIERHNKTPWALRELLDLAQKSSKSVFAQSPYIVPSRSMKSELNEYNIDYNDVKLLTNSLSSSPNPFAIAGYTSNRKLIIDSGANVFEYQGPGSIHAKTYIFDDYISVIGSFNLDARSSHLSTESMVIIEGKEFASELMDNINKDLDKSLKVDRDYSYIDNEEVNEARVPIIKRIYIGLLSRITLFIEYLI